ncbi:response regulator [Chamaesiphon sp.]|uniref:response regulator n=1 Tax=Chamaesiphon sp. TaxID=2814140 RepID=UPI003593063B
MATSKILVIDDSRVIRKTVRDMLPEGDFEVIEAKDGLEGIGFVETAHPALIMLDFILPKMSGWDVFQQIQAHPEYQKIPLVLMSGKKEEVTSKISEPFEYFEFIEKPFDRVVLAEAIRVAMTKARKARPRMAELPAAVVSVGESPVSNDEIAQLQAQLTRSTAQLDHLQTATATQIQELQAQLLQVDRDRVTAIEQLTAQLEFDRQTQQFTQDATAQQTIELKTDIDTLKKQLGQLVVLIKKRLT